MRRLPHWPGRADLQLWRRFGGASTIYAPAKEVVYVRADSPQAQAWVRRRRAAAGDSHRGQWVPVRLAPSALQQALGSDLDLSFRSTHAHRPFLELSVPEIGAHSVHRGLGMPDSHLGDGVLVGIIDTGIDLHHPAFRDANGETRVVAVWDQDAPDGTAPEPFGYGHECTRDAILEARCRVDDPQGHGTHVAGIAAGNRRLGGVAPQADIAMVRSERFTRLADAIDYLIGVAEARDQPLVINLSVGGHYGPHMGKSPLEQYIAEQVGPGRIVVAAAGNDGASRIHVGTQLHAEPVRTSLQGLPKAGRQVEAVVELWTEPLADTDFAVELWLGDDLHTQIPLDATDSELLRGELTYQGSTLAAINYTAGLSLGDGKVKHTLAIDRATAEPLPDGARLALKLAGEGRLDGWIGQSDYRFGVAEFGPKHGPGWLAGDGRSTLAVPATSPDVITVGAYAVRATWQQGPSPEAQPFEVGALAPYSSSGPTLDTVYTGVKPDICAPGAVIKSARALTVPPGPRILDENRMVMQGTSMAAPHVAGVVALMLEANPRLTPDQARELLQETARGDPFTGDTPNTAWGFGKIDAHAAVALAEKDAPQGCSGSGAKGLAALFVVAFAFRRRRLSS